MAEPSPDSRVSPIRHHYLRGTYRNGWAILDFECVDRDTVKIAAFGLKREKPHRRTEEAYLLPGEEVVISMPDGEVLYEIVTINYLGDPYDMYRAELRYIQHLSGWRIVNQRDEKQQARQLEWASRQRSKESAMLQKE